VCFSHPITSVLGAVDKHTTTTDNPPSSRTLATPHHICHGCCGQAQDDYREPTIIAYACHTPSHLSWVLWTSTRRLPRTHHHRIRLPHPITFVMGAVDKHKTTTDNTSSSRAFRTSSITKPVTCCCFAAVVAAAALRRHRDSA
jgi:hypothetical protein